MYPKQTSFISDVFENPLILPNCKNFFKEDQIIFESIIKKVPELKKLIDKQELKVVLGDLGGICKRGDTHISTYPPYESRFDRGIVKCNEKTMVWGVGIIALELIGYNIDEFSWSVFGELSQNDIKYLINIYTNPSKYTNKKIIPKHEELLKKILELNPQKRCDLKTIIKSI